MSETEVKTTAKTANKTRSKSEEKRQLILTAATDLFCDKGFLATSMDHIAKQAGVSKQTVYSHFGNKEDLFKASINSRCNLFRMSSMPEDMLNDPRKALLAFSHNFIELILSKEGIAIHRICIFESQTNPEISQLFFAAGPEPVIAEMSDIFKHYTEQGLLNINDPHMAAIQFLSMIKGEAMMRREYNTKMQLTDSEISQYIEKTIDLFLTGYGFNFNKIF
ncbi:TetR/AcrR family transcriptional regulator [Thalassomonas sp. M1454]|uniref:TetR/AcrR family transcriptional regulator n=1 Tax=Thalassomonas sp. M1454 TaxID=2594477 RepID=UPI00117F71DD|nr:TetR/AcrR family transcriptional regulator [Thalassomonas sp. M1454]TRX55678.1 TetR/AcrR family transcriptional regulator [Thalassomonas sp. M1454]